MNKFFLDHLIPADVHVGLTTQYTSPDGESFPVSIKTGVFTNVIPGITVVYHKKLYTEFEYSDKYGGYGAKTYFTTGIFTTPCKTFEHYWLRVNERALASIFNVFAASLFLDRISYEAYGEDFSGQLNPDLWFTKYYWSLSTHIIPGCLPELECEKDLIDVCLNYC